MLNPLHNLLPTDPLEQDVTVGRARANQSKFFTLKSITTISITIGILGGIPLFYLIVNPWIQNPTSLTREQTTVLVSTVGAYIALSLLLFYTVLSITVTEQRFNNLHSRYLSIIHSYSPLFNVLRNFRFAVDHIHMLASNVAEINGRLLKKLESNDEEAGATDEEERLFLVEFLTQAARIFEYYSSARCSVCIKFFDQGEQASIFTLARDMHSSRSRIYVDRDEPLTVYKFSNNTAFRAIADERTDDSSFICNDLRALAGKGEYNNSNPNWSKYYNATVVVPIKGGEFTFRESAIGFLCVDSLEGVFSEEIAVPTLQCLAALLYNYFSVKEFVANYPLTESRVPDTVATEVN